MRRRKRVRGRAQASRCQSVVGNRSVAAVVGYGIVPRTSSNSGLHSSTSWRGRSIKGHNRRKRGTSPSAARLGDILNGGFHYPFPVSTRTVERGKVATAREAVQLVRSGDTIATGTVSGAIPAT
jgi:hypothetical protein